MDNRLAISAAIRRAQITQLREAGQTISEIAEQFGVGIGAIYSDLRILKKAKREQARLARETQPVPKPELVPKSEPPPLAQSPLQAFSARNKAQREAEPLAALEAVKAPVRAAAEFARRELPVIEKALAEADRFIERHIAPIDFGASGPPKLILDLLGRLDALRINPGTLRIFLRSFDELTVEEAWGDRPDGELDRNAAANIRGRWNFSIANGCANAIDDAVKQLRYALVEFEQHLVRHGLNAGEAERFTIVPPEPERARPNEVETIRSVHRN